MNFHLYYISYGEFIKQIDHYHLTLIVSLYCKNITIFQHLTYFVFYIIRLDLLVERKALYYSLLFTLMGTRLYSFFNILLFLIHTYYCTHIYIYIYVIHIYIIYILHYLYVNMCIYIYLYIHSSANAGNTAIMVSMPSNMFHLT